MSGTTATESGAGTEKNLQEIELAEGGGSGGVSDQNANADSEKDKDKEKEKENEDEKRQERFLNDLQNSETQDNEDRKLRTGSLKRFFRKKPHKTTDASLNVMRSEQRKSYGSDDDDRDEHDRAGSSEASNYDTYKRFKYRLGGLQRHTSNNSPEGDSKMDLSDTQSKVTLKSSLSTYWNAVFKKKKSKSVHDGMGRTEDMGELGSPNAFSESALRSPQRDSTLADDIHALKISDDPNGN